MTTPFISNEMLAIRACVSALAKELEIQHGLAAADHAKAQALRYNETLRRHIPDQQVDAANAIITMLFDNAAGRGEMAVPPPPAP